MYSIHNRDDLEKLKKLQRTQSLLKTWEESFSLRYGRSF